MVGEEKYIDFGVAPYALPGVCEALFNNGIDNAFLTLEDGNIHVRWKYDARREFIENKFCKDNDGANNGEA